MDNSPILVALNLAASAALLIWAVRLVHTGFERAFVGHLKQWLKRSTSNRFAAAITGAAASTQFAEYMRRGQDAYLDTDPHTGRRQSLRHRERPRREDRMVF